MALSRNYFNVLLCGWVALLIHNAAQVQTMPVGLKLALLSEESGKFVVVGESGEVKATGDIDDPAAHFYPTVVHNNHFRFESVHRGKYLLVVQTGSVTKLIAGAVTDFQTGDNDLRESASGSGEQPTYFGHEWEQIFLSDPVKSAFRLQLSGSSETECFIAFDRLGEAVEPCGNVTAYHSAATLSYRLISRPIRSFNSPERHI